MGEGVWRALNWLGWLGGWRWRRRSKHYYYVHHGASTRSGGASQHDSGRGRSKMGKNRPLSLQIIELKVRMCCEGCEGVVKRALRKLRGVDSVEVDLVLGKVTVSGYVDRNKVLKQVRRSGKKAEFWPNPDLPLHFTSTANYFHDEELYRAGYNYWRHGYSNAEKHGNLPANHRGDDHVSNMFNDDDVNACEIM